MFKECPKGIIQMKHRKKVFDIIFLLSLFFLCYIFFTNIHPLTIYDSDDWAQYFRYRNAIPIWGSFNPVKLFPETLMPLSADIAGYILYPLLHDFIYSLTLVTAFWLCFFITWYIYEIYRFIEYLGVDGYGRIIAFCIFFLHFVLFKISDKGYIPYLFGAHNVSCVFHYSIPMLLNMILVIRLAVGGGELGKGELAKGVTLLCVYLAIFSNLYCSIILMSYAASKIIIGYVRKTRPKYFKLYIGISLLYICSLMFEWNGTHRRGFVTSETRIDLWGSIISLFRILSRMNGIAYILLIILCIGIVIFIKYRSDYFETYNTLTELVLAYGGALTAYIILQATTGSTGVWYVSRVEVLLGIAFYPFLFLCCSLYVIYKKMDYLFRVIPILSYILVVNWVLKFDYYMPSTCDCVKESYAYELASYELRECEKAEQGEKMPVYTILIPIHDTFESRENWPHMGFGDSLSKAAFRYGFTKTKIPINVKPDISVNEKYNIPYNFYNSGLVY